MRILWIASRPSGDAAVASCLVPRITALPELMEMDLVVIEGLQMGGFPRLLPTPLRNRSLWLLDDLAWPGLEHEAGQEPHRVRRLWLLWRAGMLRRWLLRHAKRFGGCAVSSRDDWLLLRRTSPCLRLTLLPVVEDLPDARAYRQLVDQMIGSFS